MFLTVGASAEFKRDSAQLQQTDGRSELQTCHDRSGSRRRCRETRGAGCGRVGVASTHSGSTDVPKTVSSEARYRIRGLRREWVCRRRWIYPCPIKYVGELGAKQQADFLAHPESTAQTHTLIRPALLPKIAVMRVRSTKVSVGRIAPCFRIQHERSFWVIAAAIDIEFLIRVRPAFFIHPGCCEQRFSWHAFDQGALEDQRIQIRGRGGNSKRNAAGVTNNSANLPVACDPGERLSCKTRSAFEQTGCVISSGD